MLFNCYFSHQSNYYRSFQLLTVTRILQILIVLTVNILNSAVADSLSGYCIFQAVQQGQAKKPRKDSKQNEIPLFIGSIENLPELYKNPCNKIERFFFECIPNTFYSYSPTLDRAFIQGYRKTDWRRDFAHLEISESGTKSVPKALVNSGFVEDIPALNGALFQGHSGEALFYDGSQITNISSYFPKLKRETKVRSWYLEGTSEGRIFLAVDFVHSKGSPFLMELQTGLRFIFIPVPKELENTYVKLFTLPNDSRLWGMAKNTILAEIDGKLKNILIVRSSLYIIKSAYVEQLADGSIAFQVENKKNKSITNYVLKHDSSASSCEITLDANRPIILEPR